MNDNERLNYGLLLAHNLMGKGSQTEAVLEYLEGFYTADAIAELRRQAVAITILESKAASTLKLPTP